MLKKMKKNIKLKKIINFFENEKLDIFYLI